MGEQYPPAERTVTIFIDEKTGEFSFEPENCWIREGGKITFRTDEKTDARVIIPDTASAWEIDEFDNPVPNGNVCSMDLNPSNRQRFVRVKTEPDKIPYSIFQLDPNGKVIGGVKRAPVIIIVRTYRY